MNRYFVLRLLQAIPLLIGISIAVFVMLQLTPGGPLGGMFDVSMTGTVSAEDLQRLRARYDLDDPIWLQYLRWASSFVRGDWGTSFVTSRPVTEIIVERIPATLAVTGVAFLAALLLAFPLGILAAVKQYSWLDYTSATFAFLGISTPRFWSALMLLFIFSYTLGWLPAFGLSDTRQEYEGWATVADRARHLVLPVTVMMLYTFASLMRFVRAAMLEVLGADYLRTARAKGLAETSVILRHGLKNSAIPVVTIVALQIPDLFVGSVIVESIFAIPGTGRLFVEAAGAHDYPVLLGILMISSALVVAANLVADVVYGL